jgi:hypothetical protein
MPVLSTLISQKPVSPVSPKTQKILIYGDQALADELGASLSTVRTWRLKRLVPFIKTGHKSVIFDLNKVMAALEVLETKAIERKGMR